LAAVPSTGRADQVDRLAAPEADATRTLYERHANQIFGYCLHQLGSREEAEDAVQSTFLNAFRGLKRGVVPELEAAWLFKIAHNVCLSRRRSSWRRGRIESPADFDLVEELAPAPSRRADELIGLQDVLETMPENQRRAILLREWQGLSYHEIADELGLTQSAVETLIFRARRSLASGLEQPPEPAKRRLRARAGDLGNVLAGMKSMLLGSAAAAKVAATVAVISATTVVAAAPVQSHVHHTTPAAPSSSTSPGSVRAGGTALVQAPVAALQRGRAGLSHHRGGSGHGSVGLSVVAPFGSAAVVDGTGAPADTQTSPATSTQPSGDQQAQQPQQAPEQPSQPSQPVGSAPAAPQTSGATAGPTTKTQDGTGSTQTVSGPPLSQTATPGLSATSGQGQSGPSSSGSGSSSGTTTAPVGTPRSLPVPPIPVPEPIATTPVTTTPVTTNPVTTSPPASSSGGSQTTTTTTITGGPLSQHVSPGLSTTSGSGTSTSSSTTTTTSVPVRTVTAAPATSGTVTGNP
jgi:RNA polymerase sigma factor (sigma-70 family)